MVKKTKKQAFTIVELVIVIAVIAILAAIIIPTYSNLVKKANEATALVDAKNMITEMLADILSGDKDAADILVFSKKGNDVFLYGYDASRGVVLPYKVSPLKDFGKNLTVTNGHEFYNQAASFCETIKGTDINKVTVNIDDWRKPEVLNLGVNREKSTVEELGFDKNTMAVFANYDIVPESFAKKDSGGEEVHTHVWSTEWTKNSTHHWHDCTAEGCTVTVDSEKDGYGAHSWGDGVVTTEPTESTEGEKTFTCTACGATKTEKIPAIGHVCKDHLTRHDRVDATCTKEGNVEYWECTCGKKYSDVNAEHEITETVIAKLPHTYSESKYDDTNHWKKCANCEATSEKAAHEIAYININESTHDEKCKGCSYAKTGVAHTYTDGVCKCGHKKVVIDLSKPVYLYKKGNFTVTYDETTKTFYGNNTIKYNSGIKFTYDINKPDATYDSIDDLFCNAVKSSDLSGYVYRNTGNGWNLDITFMSEEELNKIRYSTAYDENYAESEDGYYRLVDGVKYYCQYWDGLEIVEGAFIPSTDSLIVFKDNSSSSGSTSKYNSPVLSSEINLYIDLNGHTWTHTSSLTINGKVAIASSAEGGTANGKTIIVSGGTLDLYDATLDGNASNNVIAVSKNGTLNIYSGKICNGSYTSNGGGGGVSISLSTLNMYGGEISGNTASYGGGVLLTRGPYDSGNSVFNMYGGKICGNTASLDSGPNGGGGVAVKMDSVFNMYDGEISGNDVKKNGKAAYGCGVYVYAGYSGKKMTATFNMYGGTISSNTNNNGDNVYGSAIGAASYSSNYGKEEINLYAGTISGSGEFGVIYLYDDGVTVRKTDNCVIKLDGTEGSLIRQNSNAGTYTDHWDGN